MHFLASKHYLGRFGAPPLMSESGSRVARERSAATVLLDRDRFITFLKANDLDEELLGFSLALGTNKGIVTENAESAHRYYSIRQV